MRWTRITTALAFALVASAAVAQKGTATREAFYRCKDTKGQTHYGDSVPPPCIGVDTEVLNDRGTVMRVIEGEQTKATRLKREAEEENVRKERDQRRLRDRTLVESYLSVQDIERLRDQRVDMLEGQYKLTEQNIASLLDRQTRLRTQIARFKPYNDAPNAPPLPDHLAEEMVNTVNGLRVYEETLTKTRKEQAEVKAMFEADIRRFKELKSIK
jgi:hypothetical protein